MAESAPSTSARAALPKPSARPLGLAESFMCGGLAGCAAVTICKSVPGEIHYLTQSANIPETLKTRLQLQGELQRTSPDTPRVYKGLTDVFVKTWKNEGIRGLQRGLGPAVRPPAGLSGFAVADGTVRISSELEVSLDGDCGLLRRIDLTQWIASRYVTTTRSC